MHASAGKIELDPEEWAEFAAATFAPWVPRTIAEFDAMCVLGSARHLAEDTGGKGFIHALAAEAMRFGPQGECNFPIDARKLAYLKVHGEWPAPEEMIEFRSPDGLTMLH